jgi:transcriptional regulator with XRE-family HTH domain
MRTLLHTEFAALLARAGVSQAAFARLAGLTARQVNNWCRGHAVVPPWAMALAVLLEQHSPEAIAMLIEETAFAWHETLGIQPNAEADTVRLAMHRLALRYHPDQAGNGAQMIRINAAYAEARTALENRWAVEDGAPPRSYAGSDHERPCC